MGKRRYTAEERAEKVRQDQELLARANEALTDEATVRAYAVRVLQLAGGMQRFSLRNQALLLSQADERDLALTGDIDTFRGWCARGRVPRGKGLRIVVPKGTTQQEQQKSTDESEPQGQGTDENADEEPRFRMSTRFDFCQTVSLDDADEVQTDPEPPGDAAEWVEQLHEQAERAGAEPIAPEGSPEQQAAALAAHVAQALSTPRASREQATAQAEDPQSEPAEQETDQDATEDGSGVETLRLPLSDNYGTARVQRWNAGHGRVCYEVTAPRVQGVFTLIPEFEPTEPHALRPSRLEVRYGAPDPADPHSRGHVRSLPHSPVVNGVELTGGIITDAASILSGRAKPMPNRRTGPMTQEPAPTATQRRTAAVVRALVEHWDHHADKDALIDDAARAAASQRAADTESRVRHLDERMRELAAERAEHATFLDELAALQQPADPEPRAESTPLADVDAAEAGGATDEESMGTPRPSEAPADVSDPAADPVRAEYPRGIVLSRRQLSLL